MAECLRTPSLKCLLMLTAYVIAVHFPSKEIKSLLLLSFRLYSDFNNFPLMLSFSSRTQTACRLIWLSSFFKACLSLCSFSLVTTDVSLFAPQRWSLVHARKLQERELHFCCCSFICYLSYFLHSAILDFPQSCSVVS